MVDREWPQLHFHFAEVEEVAHVDGPHLVKAFYAEPFQPTHQRNGRGDCRLADAASDGGLDTWQPVLEPGIQNRFAVIHQGSRAVGRPCDELEALRHVGLFEVGAQIPDRIAKSADRMRAAVGIDNSADDDPGAFLS